MQRHRLDALAQRRAEPNQSWLAEFALDIVETPNGKAFILENDKADTNKWYLNH